MYYFVNAEAGTSLPHRLRFCLSIFTARRRVDRRYTAVLRHDELGGGRLGTTQTRPRNVPRNPTENNGTPTKVT